MRKTITNFLALGLSLLCLLILGACPPGAGTDTQDTNSPGSSTPDRRAARLTITNVPSEVREGGPESFKIFVQFSTSMNDKDPHTAISSGKIAEHKNQDGSVTLSLYEDHEMTTPWDGSGSFYIAVTICPENAPSAQAVQVKVPALTRKPFPSETNTIDWNTAMDLGKYGFLASRIQAIYDRIIKEDGDIITGP